MLKKIGKAIDKLVAFKKTTVIVLALPVVAMVLFILWGVSQERSLPDWELTLAPINVPDAAVLEAVFNDLDYRWPLAEGALVPPVMVDPLPKDLAEVKPVKLKKSLFFRALLPLVLAENKILIDQRRYMLSLFSRDLPAVGSENRLWLEQQLVNYRVKGSLDDESTRQALARRLDEVPMALVLAQAANESGWGSSRFAHEAKNLFGEWTYKEGQGLVPEARAEDERHAVRIFPSLRSSVRSYLNNINSGRAYDELRMMRETLRNNNQPLDALKLAQGLTGYSERDEEYVKEIRRIIRLNRLNLLTGISLNLD